MTGPNVYPHQPEFVDNRDDNTLAAALIARVDHLCKTLATPPDFDVATGYFNPEGFGIVARTIEKVGHIRLLLGAEPVPPPARPVRHLGDPRGARFEGKLLREALARTEGGLLRDRDRMAFAPGTDRAIQSLLAFLKSGKIEVRRYTKRFLHGKAFAVRGHGVIAGSSNFTAGGLVGNLELNLGQYQPRVSAAVERWFDDLWAEAEPFDLASIYEARYFEYDPYLIYLKVLLERYGAELEEERPAGGPIPLTRFQTDGIDRAARILDRYNGVLIADSVGLGKTFITGEALRRVIEQERRRALLIAPATLRDGTWARFAARYSLYIEALSFEQLAADKQLGGTLNALDFPLNDYSLIVVDEAHAMRNPDTRRAHALRKLLEGDPPKKLMLMTATPVNNSLWDLYHLLCSPTSAFASSATASRRPPQRTRSPSSRTCCSTCWTRPPSAARATSSRSGTRTIASTFPTARVSASSFPSRTSRRPHRTSTNCCPVSSPRWSACFSRSTAKRRSGWPATGRHSSARKGSPRSAKSRSWD